MNWVGGSRNRLVMRNDGKKQREFFAKRKMQQKLKSIGISLPTPSPTDASSGSVDLMTLFIVNQIAAKKGCKDPPKVPVLGSCKGGVGHKRKKPLVLPMSPCSPSRLCLVEGQPDYSVQESRKTKYVIPQVFKCRQLSPVFESGFSGNSESDYLPAVPDAPSPFSSSSASPGQGIFPLHLNLQKQSQTQSRPSPTPWDTSVLSQSKPFHPFSQPRGMTNTSPWSCKANQPFFQVETPTASQVLFGSPEPGKTKIGDHARYEDTFSLNQPKEQEPMLDFTLNQSETQQQFEEDVFRGFSNEECGRERHSNSGSEKSITYLTDQTSVNSSTPQTVPDSESMGVEVSNYTKTSFSCLGRDTGPESDSEYGPSYSCRGVYLSSDSNDFHPFSQPRGMTNTSPWSCKANQPFFQVETPTASQVLFGSPEPGKTKIGDHARYEDTFSLNQPKEQEPMLDFTLNQSETQQQFEEDVFRGFSNEECGRERHSNSGSEKSITYLTDQTSVNSSTPQTVPDSESMGVEVSNYTKTSFSCLGRDTGPESDSEYGPSYSCRGVYLSSDSNDDEDCCQPCVLASPSYMDPAFSTGTLNGPQGNPKPKFSEHRPHTQLQIRAPMDFRDDLKVTENMATPDNACGNEGQEKKSSTTLLLSPHPPAQTQSSDVCKCKKTSSETRDAGTQTVYSPPAEACDASTQCSFVADSAREFSLHLPNADMSAQPPATGRQADTATETDTLTASTEISRSEEEQTPWSKKKSKEDSLSGRSMIPANNRAKVILQRPTKCFLNPQSTGQENKKSRDEREQHENCPPIRNFSDQGRGEGASATRVNILSNEVETLQDIASILRLLKQREIQG